MFLNEEPQHAGTICMEIVPLRMAAMISSRVRESGSSILEVLLHQGLIALGGGLQEDVPPAGGLALQVGGDFAFLVVDQLLRGVVEDGLHVDEVDDAFELVFGTDRETDGNGGGTELLLDFLDTGEEVGADPVHLVHVGDLRHAVLVCLTPDGLALGLDASDRAESGHRAVQDAQGTFHFHREVDVAGSVDQVDLIGISVVVPERRRRGRGDGDAPLLFLDHPVHRGRTFVDLTDLVGLSGVVEDALGRGGLTGIDVGHDADVTGVFKISLCHSARSVVCLETEVCKGLVGLSHSVHVFLALEGAALVVERGDDFGAQLFCHRVTGTLAGERDHVLHGHGDFPFRTQLGRHLEVRAADTTGLDLDLRGHVLERFLPNIERSLVRIFHLLAHHVDGIIKDRIRDTLLPLQHKIVHETGNLHVVKLRIRK